MNNIKELINFSKTLKVLYVEDNKEARESMHLMLKNFFNDIVVAHEGKDGYDRYIKFYELNNRYFDIVITDITMPKMNGLDMSKLIVKENKEQYIIFISAHDDSERLQEIMKIGMSSFIHKPIKIDNLTSVLSNISNDIRNKELEKQELSDIQKLNQELDTMVEHFDKYVIASRTDLKGKITYASKAYEAISGYTKKELLGQPHNMVRHPDMPSTAFEDMWKTIQDKKLWVGEVKNLRKDGSSYWVQANIAPYYNKSGEHIGYSAIRHDITAQKEVENLKEQMEDINRDLEQQVMVRIGEVYALNQEIKDTQKEVVFTMGTIGESRSEETGNHVKRVAEYSKILALHYGLNADESEMLKEASPMHDIGKVAIPDSILNKPARLTQDERDIMDTHTTLGFEMLCNSNRDLLKMAATISYEHHEKYDGSGYPRGLKGEKISIYGRITALADVFDALGSSRVYKQAWSDEKIFKMFEDEKGKHFDPKLVDIFMDNINQFIEVRNSLE